MNVFCSFDLFKTIAATCPTHQVTHHVYMVSFHSHAIVLPHMWNVCDACMVSLGILFIMHIDEWKVLLGNKNLCIHGIFWNLKSFEIKNVISNSNSFVSHTWDSTLKFVHFKSHPINAFSHYQLYFQNWKFSFSHSYSIYIPYIYILPFYYINFFNF
jgi:hypothetical protein